MKDKIFFTLIALIFALAVTLIKPAYFFAILIIAFLILFFKKYQTLGISLVALLYPFIYLQYWNGNFNLPYVDLVAIFVFIGWALNLIHKWTSGEEKFSFKSLAKLFPGLLFFSFFAVASLLSLYNTENIRLTIKYIARPIFFFYLMFIILPFNLINTEKILNRILYILYGVGIFVAGMGAWSLIFPPTPGLFRRAVPIAIFGYTPLGTNHNLIAEVLIAVIPVALYLVYKTKNELAKKWLVIGTFGMILINLVTFSRTAWIALSVELIILVLVWYRKYIQSIIFYLGAVVLVISPIILYMYNFTNSNIVESSNQNRIELTKIALQAFEKHPIIGNGAGTFLDLVASSPWYVISYGAPLEAHGVVQKLLAETGILGFISFFALFGYFLYYLIKSFSRLPKGSSEQYLILALILTCVGSLIFQLFNTSYYISKLWFPVGLALAAANVISKKQKITQ